MRKTVGPDTHGRRSLVANASGVRGDSAPLLALDDSRMREPDADAGLTVGGSARAVR